MERQANRFASHLLLPSFSFATKVSELRDTFGIKDRGHGYIFVDDQPCNYSPYNDFLSELSLHFETSKQAIEIRLNQMGLLNDRREKNQRFDFRRKLD
jgi:Zn-dependent peptidase ImmA (M78 family)